MTKFKARKPPSQHKAVKDRQASGHYETVTLKYADKPKSLRGVKTWRRKNPNL